MPAEKSIEHRVKTIHAVSELGESMKSWPKRVERVLVGSDSVDVLVKGSFYFQEKRVRLTPLELLVSSTSSRYLGEGKYSNVTTNTILSEGGSVFAAQYGMLMSWMRRVESVCEPESKYGNLCGLARGALYGIGEQMRTYPSIFALRTETSKT